MTAPRPELAMPRELIEATGAPDLVSVPARTVLAIDGQGEPGGTLFRRCLQALYGAAYTLKFARKHSGKGVFAIGPLEGRWWWDRPGPVPPPARRWRWTLRIGVPRNVTASELRTIITHARQKKGSKLADPEATSLRVEKLRRQTFGRMLHVGPYINEPASLDAIARTAVAKGRAVSGPHVEVYLSDPRRVAPSRLRTVLLRELLPSASRSS